MLYYLILSRPLLFASHYFTPPLPATRRLPPDCHRPPSLSFSLFLSMFPYV